MASLIFILSFLTVLVLFIVAAIKAVRKKPARSIFKTLGIIVSAYFLLWLVFYIKSQYVVVPPGTDVCFDDWCATITKIDHGDQLPAIPKDSTWVVLHVAVSNKARGIAQKPSEPRIHIIDGKNSWAYSLKGQQALERVQGTQPGIDSRLELHRSLNTLLVYEIPANDSAAKVLIEEGPFITDLIFPDDKQVFKVP